MSTTLARWASAALGSVNSGGLLVAWILFISGSTSRMFGEGPPAFAADQTPPTPFDRFSTQLRGPVDWFSWGADYRVRNEYMDEIVSLSGQDKLAEQNVVRSRGRVWAALTPLPGLSFNTRLTAEPREWTRPAFSGAYRGQTGMEWRYGLLDQLNVKWTNAFDVPLAITAGRQEMAFGDYWNWWLVSEGTPADGSWSCFLDGVRVSYDVEDIQTKLDLVYISQSARPDERIPTLGYSSDACLTEQDEQGVILYAANKSLKNTQVDGYFIYKGDDPVLPNGDTADIYTMGGRLTGTPWAHWRYALEGAYQGGAKQDPTVKNPVDVAGRRRTIDAFGANARLTYSFQDKCNNQLHLSFEYLSGDDPNSPGTDEMFDVLWGRWPRFSEGYIYSYINETGGRVAQLNNIERLGAGWTIAPSRSMTVSAWYNAWFAPESVPTRARVAGLFSGDGQFRGHFLQTVLKKQFTKHLSTHLWGEFIWSGDYYAQSDFMKFLRAEVLLTF